MRALSTSLFEFISGMIGVLITLAIAQLLISTGRLVQLISAGLVVLVLFPDHVPFHHVAV